MSYHISDNKDLLDIGFIHYELSRSYWAKNIPMELVQKSITHSMCFGVYIERKQIGFARVITDHSTFAYLCDVIIAEEAQGKGAGKMLMEYIMKHKDLQGLRRFMLATRDAHTLYEKYGFSVVKHPERLMEITVQNPYSADSDHRLT
ncbi:MAG: GNAT family N-acetyltransferase [Bacteroidia bacterium]|nr:GNAT family N-acetyltransferase [Bacteroidia bacterium]